MPDYRTTRNGIDLIKRFEGFLAKPEQLESGRWLIGFGQVRTGQCPEPVTRSAAEKALRQADLPEIEQLISKTIFSAMNQNEFDALVSFAYSLGADTFSSCDVVRHLNSGHRLEAARAMEGWVHAELGAGVQPVDTLMRRRAAEKALFLKPAQAEAALASARFPVRSVSAAGAPPRFSDYPKAAEEPADLREDIRQRLIRIVGPDGIRAAPAAAGHSSTSPEAIKKAVSDLAQRTNIDHDRFVDDLDSYQVSEDEVRVAVHRNAQLAERPLAWITPEFLGLGIFAFMGLISLVGGLVWSILAKRGGSFTDGGLAVYAPGSLYLLGGLAFVLGVFTLSAKWHALNRP